MYEHLFLFNSLFTHMHRLIHWQASFEVQIKNATSHVSNERPTRHNKHTFSVESCFVISTMHPFFSWITSLRRHRSWGIPHEIPVLSPPNLNFNPLNSSVHDDTAITIPFIILNLHEFISNEDVIPSNAAYSVLSAFTSWNTSKMYGTDLGVRTHVELNKMNLKQ